jgi:hypothetical protein
MAYASETEALQQAHYTLVKYQNDLTPYQCRECNQWHLAPKKKRINFEPCAYCLGRQGNYKLTYPDEHIAEVRAERLSMTTLSRLRPYECPHGEGWHLTSSF